jgi:AcrR family transcriptional regulator
VGAATRAKIVDAALAVLAEKGFAGFTLQAVADRAGVFYGNVTHHYPTRDKLVDATIDAAFEQYRSRFDTLVASLDAREGGPVRALVSWLLDDAVVDDARVFLELWAMASRMPHVAQGLKRLYDDAVDTSMRTLGVDPHAESSRRFREALFLLSAVTEGTTCIFFNRDRAEGDYGGFRREAVEALVPMLEERLAEAKAAAAGTPLA